MTPIPVYRVTSMEAGNYDGQYNYEISLQPIPEDESIDLSVGAVSEDGYERPTKMQVKVTEEVFHSLRIGMLYQLAFAPTQFKEVA